MVDKAGPSNDSHLNTAVLLILLLAIGILVVAIGIFAFNIADSLAAYPPSEAPTVTAGLEYHSTPTPYPTYIVQKFYIDRDLTIEPGHFADLDYQLPGGVTYRISASTDGAPLNILVFDNNNYVKYRKAGGHDDGTWRALAVKTAVVNGSFTFTTPSDEHYYFVWDNVGSGEVSGGRTVNVYVSVAE